MRQRWATHAPLASPHANPGPGFDLVDVHGAIAHRLERLPDADLLAAAERRIVLGERGETRAEAVEIVHDPPEAREVQQPSARAARLPRVVAAEQTAMPVGDGKSGHVPFLERD